MRNLLWSYFCEDDDALQAWVELEKLHKQNIAKIKRTYANDQEKLERIFKQI